MLETLTADDFRPRIGEAYRLTPSDGEPVDTVLATVQEHARSGRDSRTPFSLEFRAPLGTVLGQGTFRVEHAERDPIELFLVPIGPDPQAPGMLYEAVFG